MLPWPQAGVRLAPTADAADWGRGAVPLPSDVAPGATVTIDFTITGPAGGGSFKFQWRL